jgi:hypothetical protein
VEYTAKDARPLRPQNPEPKPSTCAKEAEWTDEKSYRRAQLATSRFFANNLWRDLMKSAAWLNIETEQN